MDCKASHRHSRKEKSELYRFINHGTESKQTRILFIYPMSIPFSINTNGYGPTKYVKEILITTWHKNGPCKRSHSPIIHINPIITILHTSVAGCCPPRSRC